ncbi:hypothetical protein AB0I53_39160 [Saccharopolyspora sp. NPDC050389]|uniref:hypothetical protein n=1 Tax=Saccharopolyspora sp. NPDC050389 TaxID=3155516 RepID=UPI003401FDC9
MRSRAKWTAVFCAVSALVAPAAFAAPELPPITQTLTANQGCRTPSTADTYDIPWAQARLRPDRAWQRTPPPPRRAPAGR